jgi:hypothetical protein
MRLTKDQIDIITARILDELKGKSLIVFKTDEEKVLERMREVFTADLKAEDTLEREVEEILSSHSAAIDTQRLDYRKMFNMIKMKLARERGIVL